MLFIATSNFPQAIDQAFLSRADLILTVDLPGTDACRKILVNTVEAMAAAFPQTQQICSQPEFEEAARLCQGLDGRRIRKLVASACTFNKETALDPGKLTAKDILLAVKHAQQENRASKGAAK